MNAGIGNAKALARAVILRALTDLAEPEHAREAARWLRGPDAALLLEALDLPAELVNDAIQRARGGPPMTAGWKRWRAYLATTE